MTALLAGYCSSSRSGVVSSVSQTFTRQAYAVSARPTAFETCFFPGAKIRQDSTTLRFSRSYLGCLPISSGRIVATDPVSMSQKPFTTAFPKGRFPVELAVAHFGNDERVAFARILFSSEPVAKWEMALLTGQEPLPMSGETYYGYPVDGGTGMFIDASHVSGLERFLSTDATNFNKVFISSFRDGKAGLLYAAQGDTLATFLTGLGDGHYATYVGFDAQHQPCRLLTDFQLVDWK
ncbi:DUF4241 domain-containing protein [Hymenobacter endophyticus]|uniref:DUF4241 domain-containing protein n=1 Tax=Hymenobacter endophyticus TaxID=3076335 RepID=A0ABU3TF64_9BACT|nr:DUF4241 domain-containing protein [Hymenobacter endophyticus]MDU0370016.1 DUF4241 domain-containing protein [Hymenobacter endophyticus]